MAERESQRQREAKQRFADVFGRASAEYDQAGPHYFTRFGERLTELAGVGPGQTVLDVACGRGASLFPAARHAGPDGHVSGIDLAAGMVAELTADLRQRDVHNADVLLMDAEELAFPTGAFDRVLAGFCLYFFPRLDHALAEMHRVLRPGGILAVSMWGASPPEWRWLDDLVDSYVAAPASSKHAGDPSTPDEEYRALSDPVALRALLRRAGFDDVGVVAEADEFTFAGEDEWWTSLWSTGARVDLEQIEETSGTAGLARLRAEAHAYLQRATCPEGIREVMPVLYLLAAKSPHGGGEPQQGAGRRGSPARADARPDAPGWAQGLRPFLTPRSGT
jgi:ubiquinone/menaquinone biosynthesis C-methylase UbiE